MPCPYCRSEYLVIRQRTGLEWIMLQFTDKRKYHCVSCGQSFRAPDRRKTPRPEGKIITVRPRSMNDAEEETSNHA